MSGQLALSLDPPAAPASEPPRPTRPPVPAEHEEAMRSPRPGFERAIVGLYRSLADYAEAYSGRFGDPIANDHVIGTEGWVRLCNGLLMLLNADHGRLDAATLDGAIRRLLESGGAREAIAEVRQATSAIAPLPRGKKAARTAETPIGSRRLNDRERELVSLLQVESNVAIYQPEEIIPDWSLLKDVMRALGGTWKTGGKGSKGGFRFPDDVDAAEVVRLAVATGEILDARAAELFETPDTLADELVAYLAPRPGDSVLEPSAGRGAIARAVRRACPDAVILCVEAFEPSRIELGRQGFELVGHDFMQIDPRYYPFEGCALNPPFSKQQDIRHILHAAKFLKPGGRLAAIASAGVAYRDDRLSREFRAWVESNGGTIVDNPEGSFLPATGVRTVMVKVTVGGGS